MSLHPWISFRTILPVMSAFLLLIAVACGSTAAPIVIEKEVIVEREVIKEVPVEKQVIVEREVVREVIKEVPVEVIKEVPVEVIKEVTVEVIKERIVEIIRPTNVPAPTAAPRVAHTPLPSGLPRYGGTINMAAYADTKDWDPKGSSSLSSIMSYSQLYNQIVQYDTVVTEKVVCDLCSSWDITNGGQTFTFHIRDNIKWQDGKDLTAEDVFFSMSRYMNPETKTGRSGLFRNYTMLPSEGGVKLIDDKTVEFNLQFPSGAFIKFLAIDYVKVLPKHLLEQGIDLNLAENIIEFKSGSGPFILEEYQRGNFYKVNKNPNYFKEGRPFFDRIEHFIITDTSTWIAQAKAGQIDMSNGGFTNLSPTQTYQVEIDTGGKIVAHAVQPTADWGLMINVKKEPFTDPRIRKAIHLAIDRQQWNDIVFDNTSGIGCPLMGMAHSFEECATWPGLRPKDTPGGKADIAEAKKLMAEAGFPDGFKTKYDVRQVGTYPDQCSVVKQQLKSVLGIDGDIATYPSAAGYALFGTSRPPDQVGDWELACQGEGQVVLDFDGIYGGVFLKGGTRNYTDWENDFVNDLFEKQKVETDPQKRIDINKEIELFLHSFEDNHWVTLGWGRLFWMISRDIKNFHAPQTVQTHFKHEDIWLDR